MMNCNVEASSRHRDLLLFWVSCFSLFFEILMIRWLSAEIRIFSYFHNLVLLFAFLGIGLGAAWARKRAYMLISFILMTALIMMLSLEQYLGFPILRDISRYLSVGTDFLIWFKNPQPQSLLVQVSYLVAGSALLLIIGALITVFFIPFGQILGKLFNEYERPLRAYGINLAGSLVGVWLFFAVSLLSLPPVIWFLLGGLGCLAFVWGRRWHLVTAGLLLALSVLFLYGPRIPELWTIWSPYQKLTVLPTSIAIDGKRVPYGHLILVNSVQYMQIANYSPEFVSQFPLAFPQSDVPYDHYNIPYRFADRLDDVLIVGAGAGNDAAGALRNGVQRVTAVEIDPRIIDIGRALHPERPFSDPRVLVVNDDARSFFKKSKGQYDLIVFGLLDSHTLSTSFSNVRLDNYVYTLESFQEAKQLLKPNGVMVILFEIAGSDQFIGARMQRTLAEVFGQQPVGFDVHSGFRGWGGTGFVAGNADVIAQAVSRDAHLRSIIDKNKAIHESWAASTHNLATDDWPYLYLERKSIPSLYFLVLGMIMLLSVVGVRAAYGPQPRLDWHFFFLGAGFMLLEVQNISKLALLFGVTWTVNAVVISAILGMILLSNYYVIRVRSASMTPYYAAVIISLLCNFLLPLSVFAALPTGFKEVVSGLITGIPIFFAGVIFSTSFAAVENRASALASNLLGAMVGGILESLSFVVGIKSLLLIALMLYLLSALTRRSALRIQLSEVEVGVP